MISSATYVTLLIEANFLLWRFAWKNLGDDANTIVLGEPAAFRAAHVRYYTPLHRIRHKLLRESMRYGGYVHRLAFYTEDRLGIDARVPLSK
jgi:hypothetical protein